MSDQLNETLNETLKSMSTNDSIDLDSLRTNLYNNINNMEPVTSKLNTSKSLSSFDSFWKFFKITLILVIIGLLGINLYTFFMYKKDALSYYFGDIFDVGQQVDNGEQEFSEEILEEQKDKNSDEEGTVFSKLDVAAENEAEEVNNNPDKLDKVLKEKKEIDYDEDLEKKGNYKANNISLNVNRKSGFCYLGEDRGVRTCVQVNEDDTCLSNQVFPTQELCVNPNLKE